MIDSRGNIFSSGNYVFNEKEEFFQTLYQNQIIKIERIVSEGHSSPPGFWYDQDVYEWVLLIQGNAKLRFYDEDEVVNLNPGDYLLIGPHQKHRVEETASDMETIWLAIFFK